MGAALVNSFLEKITKIIDSGQIAENDIVELRQSSYSDGKINSEEFICTLNAIAKIENNQDYWKYFVEDIVCDYVLKQKSPQDYVNIEDCEKIIEILTINGRIKNLTSLKLIIKLINNSVEIPSELNDIVLNEIKNTISTGQGITRKSNNNSTPHIEDSELGILKGVLFAISGSNSSTIGKNEADYLFEIKDIIKDGNNCPEWSDFFAKSIGNHLMAHNFYTKISRNRAIEHEKFLNEKPSGIANFISRMFNSSPQKLDDDPWDDDHGYDDIERDEQITKTENTWLLEKIHKDNIVDKYEQAILDFIKQ